MSYRKLLLFLLLCCTLAAGRAAEQNFEAGKQAYLNGEYRQAYAILEPLARDGDAGAQKMLGIMYDYGQGVDKDPKQALDWYIKAANQGQTAVQYQVGSKYFRGDGTAQDYAEAAKWWEMAAAGGQVDAQFNLGLMYFRGLGVKQDDGRAAELFRAAAKQGHAHAQYSLAVMYAFGRGVDKDYRTALDWFRKAAEQGVAQAQFNLGVFYENGYGVDRDPATAASWYKRAAAQGLAEAEDKLAALDLPAGNETDSGAAPRATAAASRQPAGRQAEAAPDHPAQAVTPAAIRGRDWLRQLPPDSYTIQIGSLTDEQAMIRFIRDNGLASKVAYVEVVIDGVTRYNGLYGHYATYEQAQQAAADLTTTLGGVKPWIRNVGILQKMLK